MKEESGRVYVCARGGALFKWHLPVPELSTSPLLGAERELLRLALACYYGCYVATPAGRLAKRGPCSTASIC